MTTAPTLDRPLRHHIAEDVLGLAAGIIITSLGLAILRESNLVTGGTAGLSLLLSYATSAGFGVLFAVINVPFLVLAALRRGWTFAVKSTASILLVAWLPSLQLDLLAPHISSVPYAAIVGNVLGGVGILILFRHGSSLGGFNVIALLLQDRYGLRAGYVLMTLDIIVVACALFVVDAGTALASACGAIILNLVIAFNHKPGRYRGW